MKTLFLVCLMILLCGFGAMLAQEQAKKYEPTEIQGLRIKVALQDAQLSEINKNKAVDEFDQKVKVFNDVIATVRKENNWPDSVQWNIGTSMFIDTKPPTPATPPATGAPAPKP